MIIKKGKLGTKSLRAINRASDKHQKESHPDFFETYMTRRELFQQGLTGITATLMAPSLLSLLLRSKIAHANELALLQRPAFLFTAQGGASFGPEVVLSDINGRFSLTQTAHQQLSGGLQTTLLEPNFEAISTKYGAGLWRRGLLFNALEGSPLPAVGNGIQISPASQLVRNNLKIVVFQHGRSDDDTSGNPNIPSHLISASALIGTNSVPLVRGVQLGRNSEAGGNGQPTIALPGFRPGSGNSISDLTALTSLRQGALSNYTDGQLGALSRTIASFAEKQMGASSMNQGPGVQQLVASSKEAADNMMDIVNNPPNLNVASDPIMTGNFPTNTTEAQIVATNVKMVLDGVAPLSVMNFTGHDYHLASSSVALTPGSVPGLGTDTQLGLRWRESLHPILIDRTIRTLNAMAAKGKSGTISWLTDGSVRFSSGAGSNLASATGEGGQTGHTSVMFIYSSPSEPLPPVQRFYLGGFDPRTGGNTVASDGNILARGPQYEGLAVYATYLGSRGALTYNQINELLPAQLRGDRALIDNLLAMNMFVR